MSVVPSVRVREALKKNTALPFPPLGARWLGRRRGMGPEMTEDAPQRAMIAWVGRWPSSL